MGDRYLPQYNGGYGRDDRDRQVDSYQPPPPGTDSYGYHYGGSRYQDRGPPPTGAYERGYPSRISPPPPPPPRGYQDVYQFRGAADRAPPPPPPPAQHFSGSGRRQPDAWRREPRELMNSSFSFRAPSGPAYPSRSDLPSGPSRRNTRDHPRRDYPRRDGQRGGSYRAPGRGPPPFRPRPAHNRDLLQGNVRETTPEQLEGMGQDRGSRFMDRVSSDDEQSGDDEPSRKKTKVGSEASGATASVPKWSNPDPYTSLPPPPTEAKKDIVQTIRKAKLEAASKAVDSVQSNADFISFSFDDDEAQAMPEALEAPAIPQVTAVAKAPAIAKDVEFIALSSDEEGEVQEDRAPSVGVVGTDANWVEHNDGSDQSMDVSDDSDVSVGDQPGSSIGEIGTLKRSAAAAGFSAPEDDDHSSAGSSPDEGDVLALLQAEASAPSGNKRKFDVPRAVGATVKPSQIVHEWRSVPGRDPTPWFNGEHHDPTDSLKCLHNELVEFYNFVRPRDYENVIRNEVIEDVANAVRDCRNVQGARDVSVEAFGSFASGLYLPTADLDLVALSPEFRKNGVPVFCQIKKQRGPRRFRPPPPRNPLRDLANHLRNVGIATNTVPVAGARVPILKFRDVRTGLRVDISFENDSGVRANATFHDWKQQFPMMPPLVVVIKQLMAMYGLNEVVHGGIGGFTIICLVVSMLQHTSEDDFHKMDDTHLGDLLLRFFDLYGNHFDYHHWALQLNPPAYVDKILDPPPRQNPQRLTIIDPNQYDNDISGGSKQIDLVFEIFSLCHNTLQFHLDEMRKGKSARSSLLGCILAGNYSSFTQQRDMLHQLYYGPGSGPTPVQSAGIRQQAPIPSTNGLHKAPARAHIGGPPATHPLPPKPVQHGHTERNAAPEPSNDAKLRAKALAQEVKVQSKTKKQQKAEKQQKSKQSEDLRKVSEMHRAESVKKNYPGIPNVPERLSKAEKNKLIAEHIPSDAKAMANGHQPPATKSKGKKGKKKASANSKTAELSAPPPSKKRKKTVREREAETHQQHLYKGTLFPGLGGQQ